MKRPVKNQKPVVSTRLAFLLMFTLFYWGFHFIYRKTNLQLSQVVFDLFAGVFTGAVVHVGIAKFFGPLLFGRCFCGWACWNASVFDILPVKKTHNKLPEKYNGLRYVIFLLVFVIPFVFIACGYYVQTPGAQFKWLLIENAAAYIIGLALAFWLGDRRAFCKYICPAGTLMAITSPKSVIKVEKNHIRCNRCRKCEIVCPMGVPVLSYISANQPVSHAECILCMECINSCSQRCLTLGIGRKTQTTTELGRSY